MIKQKPIFRVLNFRVLEDANGLVRVEGQMGTKRLPGSGNHKIKCADIDSWYNNLRDALHTYMRSKKDKRSLCELATTCNRAYNWFRQDFLRGPLGEYFNRFIKNKVLDGRIEYETDGPFFPIDLLYIGDPTKSIIPSNFLGLRMQVLKRVLSDRPYPHFPLENADWNIKRDPHLAFAYSENLPEHGRELEYFKKVSGKLGGFHALGNNIKRVGDVTKLWDAKKNSYDIIHISAHMRINSSKEAEIVLSNGVLLTPKDFFVDPGLEFPEAIPWLVFLNCCRTATENPLVPSGFVGTMTNWLTHGFIATKADVPDLLASKFTTSFYNLFLGGESIGDALMTAQAYFAVQEKDFSILAYSIFNLAPETALEKPIL